MKSQEELKLVGVYKMDEGLSMLEYVPMTKSWWQSKTVWAGLGEILLAMADWTVGIFEAGQAPGWLLAGSGGLKIVLRLLTNKPIHAPGSGVKFPLLPSLLVLLPLLLGQEAAPKPITKYEALWDCVTIDIEGNPETIAHYELAYAPAVVDIENQPQLAVMRKLTVAEATRADGTCDWFLTDWLKDIRRGEFTLWCRAYDAAGNVSAWSNPAPFSIDKIPPGQVKNLKVKVVIEIETGG